jgi:mannose-6-phosphate isomerase
MELYKNKIFRIQGKVQSYAWGGVFYLPGLLHLTAKPGQTYAEYWLGAHDQGSSVLTTHSGEEVALRDYILSFPEQTLGAAVAARFGRLPYLLKVLDVRDMLSIQVHPTKANAIIAFEKENRSGIPLQAANRNYKDDNHKPELMLALSEFWLLHGFKEPAGVRVVLEEVPELNFLLPAFQEDNYRSLYRLVMEMAQSEVNHRLDPLLRRIIPVYESGSLPKESAHFWAARAALTYNRDGNIDRGIFSIYIFNLLQLQPGMALFQDAGLPHAYLEGQNVEIMANSDNVLRGGLTPKHVDVPELMEHVRFEATVPKLIEEKTVQPGLVVFPTPAPDFELGRILLGAGESLRLSSYSAEIFLVLLGQVKVSEDNENEFIRRKGEAWVSFFQGVQWISAVGDAVIYRAAIPLRESLNKAFSPV